MKNLYFKALLLCLCLFASINAFAYDAEINGIYYNFSENEATVTCKIYNSSIRYYFSEYSGIVTIPTSVTYNGNTYSVSSIGDHAFYQCSELTSITIPNSIKSFGTSAFSGCSGLTSITIPNGVTDIGENVFYECSSLSSITIPNSVTSIGWAAFSGCSSLISINVEQGNPIFDSRNNCNAIIETATNTLIRGCQNTIIPEGVTGIYDYAFSYCSSLTSLSIPRSVITIGNGAFYNCSSLTSIDIPNGVTSIGQLTFQGCKSLVYVILPESLGKISDYAFQKCVELTDVYCYAEIAPTTQSNAFSGVSLQNVTLHVPSNSINQYKSKSPWSRFGSIVGLIGNVHVLTYIVDGNIYKSCHFEEGQNITPEPAPIKEGYSFSGWNGLPTTMPAHDVIVTGSFSINNYTLTYKVDGAVYKTISVEYGSTITPEPAPTKEGCTFSGWSEIPATMPAHDVVVTGSFVPNSYTLTYKVDGAVYKTVSVAYGSTITPEPAPTKEGHTFSGWNGLPTTMPAHDVVVTGSFSINNYTLTYKVGGAVYKTVSVVYGSTITPEPAPTKEGHTFSGWNGLPTTMPAHDVVVTGSFVPNSYTLTYKVDGAVYKTVSIVYGSTIAPEPAPTKEGYTFSGWSEIPTTMPAHDVIITGTFTINNYTLTYKVDDAVYKTLSVKYKSTITPEPAPTKEGYTFSGWSGLPATMPAHDVVVIGTFTINSYTLTYMVDGEEYITETIVYGTTLTPEEEPAKEGYTFSGWSEIPETMPAHDVVVTGSFIPNSYSLTYKVDGAVYKTVSVVYGSTITPEPTPTKEGHTFSGWSGLPATMPAHDVVVTGSFIPNSYTLTYKVDGAVYKTVSVVYGSTITPEPAPTKEGHTFSGWNGLPTTMPAHNVTATGTFAVNSYILTYKVDGAVYKSFSVNYGTALTPIAAPTKEGHTFSGWTGLPASMPAHNVEVTGSFNVISYTLTYKVDGKEYKTFYVPYGTTITPIEAPIKKGMTFSSWGNIPQTMPAYDLTLIASYNWLKKTVNGIIYQVKDTLSNYASVIGYESINDEAEIHSSLEMGGDNYVVNNISSDAFRNCSSLASVTIPEKVTNIGSNAFSGCSSLTTVTLNSNSIVSASSSSMKSIFGNQVTRYVLGETVRTIGNGAFYDCTGMISVTIGSGVISIGNNAFQGCKNLKKTIWLTNTPPSGYANVKGVINYVSNEQYTSLSNKIVYPFLSSLFEVGGIYYVPVNPSERTCDAIDCKHNKTIANNSIPSTVSYKGIIMNVQKVQPYFCYNNKYIEYLSCNNDGYIGSSAFYGCTNIISTACNNNGLIDNYAFYGCTNLTSLTLGENVSLIDTCSFQYCSSLPSVSIPNSVTAIEDYAFSGCSSLANLTIGNKVGTIGLYTFENCWSLPTISIPASVNTINDFAFRGCTKLKTLFIANRENELSLGSNGSSPLFADCPLDSVYIGGNISYNTSSSYGYSPFYRNTRLRIVVITDKETEVSPNEFYGCTNLQDFTIGDGVTSFGNWAFSGCSSLKSLSFGSQLSTIGKEAFSDCTSVTKIVSRAATPPVCGDQALDDINKWECTLLVPEGHVAKYQAAPQWKEFFFMEEFDPDAIIEVKADERTEIVRYDIQGRKIAKPQKGINIIRYSDGTSKKVLVK